VQLPHCHQRLAPLQLNLPSVSVPTAWNDLVHLWGERNISSTFYCVWALHTILILYYFCSIIYSPCLKFLFISLHSLPHKLYTGLSVKYAARTTSLAYNTSFPALTLLEEGLEGKSNSWKVVLLACVLLESLIFFADPYYEGRHNCCFSGLFCFGIVCVYSIYNLDHSLIYVPEDCGHTF